MTARTLWLPGRPIAFARPAQVADRRDPSKLRGVTPARYRTWRSDAEDYVALQHRGAALDAPVDVLVTVHGDGYAVTYGGAAHPPDRPRDARGVELTGDLDNYGKAVLDALEHGGALTNDQHVHSLELHFDPSPLPLPKGWR